LAAFGARLVVFDIFYASPGRSKEGDLALFEAVKGAGNVVSATRVGGLTDSDEKKLEIGQDRGQADALHDVALRLEVPKQFHLLRVVNLKDSALPLLPILQFSRGVGHIAGTPDKDGVYRKVALLVKLEDRCIPSLSLSALLASRNLKQDSITLTENRELVIKNGARSVAIPVDAQCMMSVNWGRLWKSFKHYSAHDVLSDNPDQSRASRYKDRIVFVGLAASGSTDLGTTPVSIGTPLSRIHSYTLDTILTRRFIVRIQAFPWVLTVAAILAIAFPVMTARLRLKTEAITMLLLCLGALIAVIGCFILWRYDVPLTELSFIFLPAACGSLLFRAASIEWEAAQARRALERYLPPELLERSLKSGMSPDLSTRRQELTIVFVDMKGFSTLSETAEVEYVGRFLKDFFEGMTRAILQYQGRIHQFLGDGFLAVFGDLVPLENHADAAVKAAVAMQQEMSIVNSKWANSGISELEDGIRIRVGINTGMVFVGDLGSDRRLEYTVVGSAVNMASRLQALAPPGGIMMTSRTRALLKNPNMCQGPEKVKLKGFEREIEVYTIDPASFETSQGSN